MERFDITKLDHLPEDVVFEMFTRMKVSELEKIKLLGRSYNNLVIKYLSDPGRLLMRIQASGPDETLALMVTFFRSAKQSACFRVIEGLARDEHAKECYALLALITNDIKTLDLGRLNAAIEHFEKLQSKEVEKNPGRERIILSLQFIRDLIQYTQRVQQEKEGEDMTALVSTFELLNEYYPDTSFGLQTSPENSPDFYMNFSGIDLSFFNLAGAYFSYARLQDVNFLNSILFTTQLANSHFDNAKIELMRWTESSRAAFPGIGSNNFGGVFWLQNPNPAMLRFVDESDFKDFIKKLGDRLTMLSANVIVAPNQRNEFAKAVMFRLSDLLYSLYCIPHHARTLFNKPEDAALFWKNVDLDLLEKTICESPMYKLAFPNQFDNLLSGARRFLASKSTFFGDIEAVKKAEAEDHSPLKYMMALREEKAAFLASSKPTRTPP
jgi:hypothetical protein